MKKEAVISIVAMLNKHGRGEVYFGIDDHGKVLGMTIGRMTIKDVTQAVVDNTEPKVYPKVEAREIDKSAPLGTAVNCNRKCEGKNKYKSEDVRL